jgi:hypothetical protein
MLRRVVDILQIVVGVAVSCTIAWWLGALGLVSQAGAPMNFRRAVAILGLIAVIPFSMWAVRSVGSRFYDDRRARSRRPSSNLGHYYWLCVEYAYRDLAPGELTPTDREIIDRTSKELAELVRRALSESGRTRNVLQLPDNSDDVKRAIRETVERFRSMAAA